MSNVKSTTPPAVLALSVALALVALVPAAAPAAWNVNGTALSGTAAIKTTDPAGGGELTVPGAAVRCEAASFEVEGGSIGAPAALGAASIVFKGCRSTTKECELVGNEIAPELPAGSGISLVGSLAVGGLLWAKRDFAVVTFEGENCALGGTELVVTGGVDFLLPTGRDERVSQLISLSSLAGQLKVASSGASFQFHGALLLASEKPWSYL